MLTVFLLLAIVAFLCTVLAAAGYPPPLWVGVIFLCILELMRALPVGR